MKSKTFYSLIAGLLIGTCLLGCNSNSSIEDNPTSSVTTLTVTPTKDSTSVLHNPLMNLVLYLSSDYNGNWSDPTFYLNDANTLANCNTVYIRSPWMNFEPTEGNYVWKNNTSFKNMVAAIKAKGWRIGFRVMCQDDGLSSTLVHGTPQFVFDAMKAAGYTNPYSIYQPNYPDVTNPVWQAKFKAFILAFGAEFDDPTITDFVDANGLGLWGEGNLVGISPYNGDHSKEKVYYDWHLGVYAQAFKHVILAVNPCTFGSWNNDGAEQKATDLSLPIGKYGCIWRRDGMGQDISVPYVEPTVQDLAPFVSTFPACPMICEPWSGFTSSDRDYMSRLIQDVNLYHGMNLTYNATWFDNPDLLAQIVTAMGYRLRPIKIELPNQVTSDGSMQIKHTWTNDGVGVLPNSNVRWNNKYAIAFALFKTTELTPTKIYIDSIANPGVLVKGTNTSFTTNIQWNEPAGNYWLAVGILDQTMPASTSLDLAIKPLGRRNGWYLLNSVTIKAK